MKRKQAIGLILDENLPAMRTQDLAAALIAEGQDPLFGEFDRDQENERRRRQENERAPLFAD